MFCRESINIFEQKNVCPCPPSLQLIHVVVPTVAPAAPYPQLTPSPTTGSLLTLFPPPGTLTLPPLSRPSPAALLPSSASPFRIGLRHHCLQEDLPGRFPYIPMGPHSPPQSQPLLPLGVLHACLPPHWPVSSSTQQGEPPRGRAQGVFGK